MVLLASESGLQHALNGFAATCDIAGMKINSSKTKVLHLLRYPVHCFLHVGRVSLNQVEMFKYLGVAFTNDERQDKEMDIRTGKAKAVAQALLLLHLVVLKRELSRQNSRVVSTLSSLTVMSNE